MARRKKRTIRRKTTRRKKSRRFHLAKTVSKAFDQGFAMGLKSRRKRR